MKIELAGYNVDSEILKRLNRDLKEVLTPETFSAAYARISRSAKDVTALRRKAREDVEKARKSNRTIIFKMGHHSVAEHAVFNFDIINVSRLAMEELERFRLVSYTEKSQRYVTLEGDYVLPAEISQPDHIDIFREAIDRQNQFYHRAYSILKDHIAALHPDLAADKGQHKLLEGWAKEDARYVLSLATEGQLGMTINARNVEHLLRRFRMSPLEEVREMGDRIFTLIVEIAPSIILFPEPSEFESSLDDTSAAIEELTTESDPPAEGVTIIQATENGDEKILAAFLATRRAMDYAAALRQVEDMETAAKENLYRELFRKMEFFDSPPREFELPAITFQAVISASNFAQLKRHRLATLLSGLYRLELGNTVPESYRETGIAEEFAQIIDHTNRAHGQLAAHHGRAADYILTNSHRRTILMKMNLREIYHFIRLRDDEHAQWDIRELARSLLQPLKKLMPLSTMLLCGKSDFIKTYRNIYKTRPKIDI